MDAIVEFTVPHLPIAQPRQRHRVVTPASGKPFVQNYTPSGDPVNGFKAAIQACAEKAMKGNAPIEGPLRVDLCFVFPRTKGQLWKRKPMPRIRHAKKPDRDNVEKAVSDALNKIVWLDDAQVCDGVIQKWIASGDEHPHVKISVFKLSA